MEQMYSEPIMLELTERELKEIKHALFYVNDCNNGTTGHNQLVLIAKLAIHLGFSLHIDDLIKSPILTHLNIPSNLSITPEKR
jgi:hypothetical protein